ncbi:MAG: photosynthetic reaction center cytochrome PufC [Xanthobacteraceae bacterium]
MTFAMRMTAAIIVAMSLVLVVGTFQLPPVDSIQRGYRGTGMVELYHPAALEALAKTNQAPEASPAVPPAGQLASQVFENVQVLKDVDMNEFLRLMTDLTAWVSPQQGCAYCHAEGEPLSADTLYTKVVARRMLEMTRHINTDWKNHVASTGVTCYTCHRGQPVPPSVWFTDPGPATTTGMAGNRAGQNWPAPAIGLTSLPYDPFSAFLSASNDPRVISTTALPEGNNHSIKQTEWTYSFMMHISQSLGVNCSFCHNTRSFTSWDQSTPQRATSWYGIRMLRDLNANYLDPLRAQLPHARLGPLGDVPKANCATCHQGVYKPLFGANMLKEYPELAGPGNNPPGATR